MRELRITERYGRRLRFGVVLALALMLAFVAACGGDDDDGSKGGSPARSVAPDDGPITIAAASGIATLDPADLTYPWQSVLWPTLWSTLVEFHPDTGTEVHPSLAESWDASEDARTYTFHLQPDAKFSTGDPLTAKDVAGTIRRALDPKTAWSAAFLFPKVEKITALDEATVRVELADPSAEKLLKMLTALPIVDVSELPALKRAQPPTSGPYKVKDFAPNDRVTLVRNEHYWGEPAPASEIRIVRAQDNSAAVTSLRSNDLDALWSPPWQQTGALEGEGFEIIVGKTPSLIALGLGDNTVPPFNDVKARQALVHATDKEKISTIAYAGKLQVSSSNQPIPASDPQYADSLPEYPFDLDRAKQLFAEAGVTEGSKLTFWTTSGAYPEFSTWGQILQSDLASIGIELEIKSNETNAWAAGFLGVDYPDMVVPNQYIFAPPMTLSIWTGASGDKYNSEPFTEAVTSADQEVDETRRNELYAEAQRQFAEDVPSLVIGQTSAPVAVSSQLSGVWVDANNTPHFDKAHRGD